MSQMFYGAKLNRDNCCKRFQAGTCRTKTHRRRGKTICPNNEVPLCDSPKITTFNLSY